MKAEVERAIAEIREAYAETTVTVREDGEGGAYAIVEAVDPGPVYRERVTWIASASPSNIRTPTPIPIMCGATSRAWTTVSLAWACRRTRASREGQRSRSPAAPLISTPVEDVPTRAGSRTPRLPT